MLATPLRLEVRDWPHLTQEEDETPGRRHLRRSRSSGPSAGRARQRPPALGPSLRAGPCSPAQAPGYSRCTSRSPVKVAEQLVTSAQGTPAAMAAAERVPRRRRFRLGPHHCGRRARGRRSGRALWAGPPQSQPTPLPLLQWRAPAARRVAMETPAPAS